jgi:hypothetical protein
MQSVQNLVSEFEIRAQLYSEKNQPFKFISALLRRGIIQEQIMIITKYAQICPNRVCLCVYVCERVLHTTVPQEQAATYTITHTRDDRQVNINYNR